MRHALAPLFSLCLFLASACRSTAPDREAAAPPRAIWVVASDLDNKPFAWVDEQGEPRGRDVEMMQLLAARLGCALEWRRMPFEQLLPAAERGEVDIVCATIGITPERARRVSFSRPYYDTAIALLERVDRPLPAAIPPGARIGASRDTTSERALREFLPQVSIDLGAKDARPALERLAAGELDALAMDLPAAKARALESQGGLRVREQRLCAEHYALALPRSANGRALCARLDRELERLRAQLAELDSKFGL